MFQTGFGTSATLFGMPDYGFLRSDETVATARRIVLAQTRFPASGPAGSVVSTPLRHVRLRHSHSESGHPIL